LLCPVAAALLLPARACLPAQHNTLPVIFKPEMPSRIGLLPLTARSGDEVSAADQCLADKQLLPKTNVACKQLLIDRRPCAGRGNWFAETIQQLDTMPVRPIVHSLCHPTHQQHH
jgi:hypothetical protein